MIRNPSPGSLADGFRRPSDEGRYHRLYDAPDARSGDGSGERFRGNNGKDNWQGAGDRQRSSSQESKHDRGWSEGCLAPQNSPESSVGPSRPRLREALQNSARTASSENSGSIVVTSSEDSHHVRRDGSLSHRSSFSYPASEAYRDAPVYWDSSALKYTDAYYMSDYSTKDENSIGQVDDATSREFQARVDSIVWDLSARGMLIHEDTYRRILEVVKLNESMAVSGISDAGVPVTESVGGWTEDEWADRFKYNSPFGEGLLCPPSCPLRGHVEHIRDLDLPSVSGFLPTPREEACSRLYNKINEWQTRIMVLEPEAFGTELKAQLLVADLVHMSGIVLHQKQKWTEFIALSYTWGAAVFPRVVNINGTVFPVTENLFAFLQRFRSQNDSSYLWIDAVCINQLDLDEKATQVRNMLTIYEKASSVVVWLGEEIEDTKLAISFLRWSHSCAKKFRNLQPHRGLEASETVNPKNIWHPAECVQHFPSVLRGVEDLCSRQWIRRIWIKQEVWAAEKIKVYCGSTVFSWDDFLFATQLRLRSEQTNRVVPQLPAEHAQCFKYLRRRKDIVHSHDSGEEQEKELNDETCEILALLNESHYCQSTDPHDQIYALLGMASVQRPNPFYWNVPQLKFVIDYRTPIAHVFSELAKSIMRLTGPHSILAVIPNTNETETLSLPSWVPDFSISHHCEFQGRMSEYAPELYPRRRQHVFRSVGMKRDQQLLERFRQLNERSETGELLLEGLCVGKLTETSSEVCGIWQVCLVEDSDDYARYMHPDQYKQRLELCERTLKGMNYHIHPWLSAYGPRTVDDESGLTNGSFPADPLSLKTFRYYDKRFQTLAVPVKARSGDLIAVVPLVATPVVLREAPESPGRFHFIGCAWLYYHRGRGGRLAADDAWAVMRDLSKFGDLIHSSHPFKERLETFVIE